jgi:sugar/nucleoside kinase (ribokinase family)
VGQNSLDRVCRLDALPGFTGKAVIREYTERPGGQVATAALAGARLGLRTAYAGAVGDDPAGAAVLEPLRSARSGERSVLWHRDPQLRLRPADLNRAAIASARALHLDAGDPETAAWAAGVAREAAVAVFLDADTPGPGVLRLLRQVDFPIVSRELAESLCGGGPLMAALAELAGPGGRRLVVTLGARGAIARCGDRVIESPGFRVEVADTTGAGDAFHGAFIWGVLQGWGAESVLRAANAAAAMNCRASGAQGGLPTRAQLDAFLRENEPGPWRAIEPAKGSGRED